MLDSESESGISFEAGEEVYGGQGGNEPQSASP